MKNEAEGRETHTLMMVHEFIRCENAFEEFARRGKEQIILGDTPERSFGLYDTYTRFLHHLYEFLKECAENELSREYLESFPKHKRHEAIELYIHSQTSRTLENRKKAILNGTAPAWENSLQSFPESVPMDFPARLRTIRNHTFGHIGKHRHSQDLTEFYREYHKYVYMIYFGCKSWWGRNGRPLPDLGPITSFSIAIRRNPPA